MFFPLPSEISTDFTALTNRTDGSIKDGIILIVIFNFPNPFIREVMAKDLIRASYLRFKNLVSMLSIACYFFFGTLNYFSDILMETWNITKFFDFTVVISDITKYADTLSKFSMIIFSPNNSGLLTSVIYCS